MFLMYWLKCKKNYWSRCQILDDQTPTLRNIRREDLSNSGFKEGLLPSQLLHLTQSNGSMTTDRKTTFLTLGHPTPPTQKKTTQNKTITNTHLPYQSLLTSAPLPLPLLPPIPLLYHYVTPNHLPLSSSSSSSQHLAQADTALQPEGKTQQG